MTVAQKVARGHHENALKHYSNGGAIPLGFVIKNRLFCIDEEAAPLVLNAF